MPHEGVIWEKKSNILSFKQIVKFVRVTHSFGINKFRITGGEPTLRKDLPALVKMIKDICPDIKIAMTTNGTNLILMAKELKKAGLNSLNISLDTLNKEKFNSITQRKAYDETIEGIKFAKLSGFDVKINAVAINGFNDLEILDFIDFSEQTGITVRFIELMPFTGNQWSKEKYISKKEMMDKVADLEEFKKLAPKDPAQTSSVYSLREGKAKIGFIASISESFCQNCNRIRLTVNGNLRPCLHSPLEVQLKEILETGSDEEIMKEIVAIVKKKWKQHPDFRLEKYKPPIDDRAMILIGG